MIEGSSYDRKSHRHQFEYSTILEVVRWLL